MSFGIALWVRDTALRLRAEGIELSKKTISNFLHQSINVYTTRKKKILGKLKLVKTKTLKIQWLL